MFSGASLELAAIPLPLLCATQRLVSNRAQKESLSSANCQSSGPRIPQPVYTLTPSACSALGLCGVPSSSFAFSQIRPGRSGCGGARPEVPRSGRRRERRTWGHRGAVLERWAGEGVVTSWAGRGGAEPGGDSGGRPAPGARPARGGAGVRSR